jgi:hypothetical protein
MGEFFVDCCLFIFFIVVLLVLFLIFNPISPPISPHPTPSTTTAPYQLSSSNNLYQQCFAAMQAAGADRNAAANLTAECDSFLDLVIGASGNEQTNIVNYYDIRL